MRKKRYGMVCALLCAALVCGGFGAALAEPDGFAYPMQPVTLTIGYSEPGPLPDWLDAQYALWNRVETLTGVHLEWVGGGVGALHEQTMLALATGDYPDLWYGAHWNGSATIKPSMAIEDGYIIDLNPYAEECPNFISFLDQYPAVRAQVTTDKGELYCFPCVDEPQDGGFAMSGLIIRMDWLEDLSLPVPQTPAEMKETLIAFRDQKGATTPITFQTSYLWGGALSAGWGVGGDWQVVDDQIVYSPLDAKYKDYIAAMAEWYAEGLIDPDMPSASKQSVEAAISNGSAGVVLNQYFKIENMIVANKDNPGYKIAGIPALTPERGVLPEYGTSTNNVNLQHNLSISSTCSDVTAAVRFCDWLFSDEGAVMMGYGTEGYTYEKVNGEFAEAGILLDESIGETKTNIMYAVAKRSNFAGIAIGTKFGYVKEATEALDAWSASNQKTHLVPHLNLTTDEALD